MSSNSDRFRASLHWLLPQGMAWPRDTGSVLMATVAGVADCFAELQDVTEQQISEWQPHSTQQRLAEWEEACGLPDRCYGADNSVAGRRAALLLRLRGAPRAYDDSSPAAPAAIEAACATMGATATARINHPMRIGKRVGTRLGSNAYLHVTVAGSWTPAQQAQWIVTLGCALERIVPARFAVVVGFA